MSRNFGHPTDGHRRRYPDVERMETHREMNHGWSSVEADWHAQRAADAIHRDKLCIVGIVVIVALVILCVLGISAWGDWSADIARSNAVLQIEGRK